MAVLGGFELRTDCPDEHDGRGDPVEFPHIIRYPKPVFYTWCVGTAEKPA
jgi:hypothetical protein